MSAPLRHIAITGAGSGIGAALARHYAGPGTRLSLLARNGTRLESVAQSCREKGALAEISIGDVTTGGAMAAWIENCWNAAPVDLLLANAGLGGSDALQQDAVEPAAKTAALVATNMLGVANVAAPLLPLMMNRAQGQIAIISSLAALFGMPQAPGYCASKAAVAIYGDALRRHARAAGVRVAVVYPGFVDTPMSKGLAWRNLFLWDADRAARHIATRLARGAGQVLFPWQMAAMARLGRMLPYRMADAIICRTQRPMT